MARRPPGRGDPTRSKLVGAVVGGPMLVAVARGTWWLLLLAVAVEVVLIHLAVAQVRANLHHLGRWHPDADG